MKAGNFEKSVHFKSIISRLKGQLDPILTIAASEKILGADGTPIGYLSAIAEHDRNDFACWELLSKWRDKHQYAYPSNFKVSPEGTGKWLAKAVLENDSRILFWIRDLQLKRLGHIGLVYSESDCSFEVDNVLRGESSVKGIMSAAMRALERWVEEEFSAEKIQLRVLKSNTHALHFYKSLGYEVTNEIALTKQLTTDGFSLVPGEIADDYFITQTKEIFNSEVPGLILTAGPSIGSLERSFGLEAVSSGWNSKHSDFLQSFEHSFAEYVGSKYAMATSSCTGALHLSLLALGIGPGDEVIVPEVTWVATASAVRYVGATPVFADIDPETWTITSETASKVLTPKTKAIMPVHLYGFGAQMTDIIDFAQSNNLFVIEDAAPAIGTLIDGRAAGTFGDLGCYSFQGAKMLVTGEGGMLVTDDETLFNKAKKIQDHGRKPGTFWIDELGYKYKMSNSTAAIGLAQLIRGENQIHRKQRIRNWYEEELNGLDTIEFQLEAPNTRSIHWMTSIKLLDSFPLERDELIQRLRIEGVDSRPVFPAISQYPFWPQQLEPKTTGLMVGNSAINLPSGVLLSRDAVSHIGSVIRSVS